MVLGQRYSGEEAKTAGIVDQVAPLTELRAAAIAAGDRLAGSEGLDRRTLSALKRDTYRNIVLHLSEPTKMYSLL